MLEPWYGFENKMSYHDKQVLLFIIITNNFYYETDKNVEFSQHHVNIICQSYCSLVDRSWFKGINKIICSSLYKMTPYCLTASVGKRKLTTAEDWQNFEIGTCIVCFLWWYDSLRVFGETMPKMHDWRAHVPFFMQTFCYN